MLLLAAFAAAATGLAERQAWPPFLPAPPHWSGDIVAAVERAWNGATFRRSVHGPRAHVPFEMYVTFVDAPDVTAAAARTRRLARYDVEALGFDWYRADDQQGARGVYRVLAREGGRRVILSWGEHSGRFLGTIRGSALTVLDLEARDDGVDQRLTAYVVIDNAVAAAVARLLVAIFGHIADRRLTEGFAISARIAEWAYSQPDEFCAWLEQAPLPAERREHVRAELPACLDNDR